MIISKRLLKNKLQNHNIYIKINKKNFFFILKYLFKQERPIEIKFFKGDVDTILIKSLLFN